MRSISDTLSQHLEGNVTTHCFVWIIERRDGVVLGFTDHDQTVIVDGVSCEPQTGMNGSEASSVLGLATSGSEIEGALNSQRISEHDIEKCFYDDAVVRTYLVNWQDSTQSLLLQQWTMGNLTRSGEHFVAELKSIAATYEKVHGRRLLRPCDAQVGDKRCQVDLTKKQYGFNGSIVDVDVGVDFVIVDEAEDYQDGWFSDGELHWLTGDNQGTTSKVVRHIKSRLYLREMPVFPIKNTDQFRLAAGCDKSFQCCKKKFSNNVNFRGFPHLPGSDAAYAYVRSDQSHDGRPLVL